MSFETPRFRNLTPASCTVFQIPGREKKGKGGEKNKIANGKHLVVDANAIFKGCDLTTLLPIVAVCKLHLSRCK